MAVFQRPLRAGAACAAVALGIAGAGLVGHNAEAKASPATSSTDAVSRLAALPIKGRAPKTGYSRDQFGQAWSDDVAVADGHNGCDTRNDVLRRDLTSVVIKPGTNGCVVQSGQLTDPYTAQSISFTRGQKTSIAVQIDHVVSLSDAWQTGAQQWDADKRRNFANDPLELQATTAAANDQKSDGDAATWLPSNKSYRCTFVSRQIEIKATYGLWVTQAEHDAMSRVLGQCGAPATEQVPAQSIPSSPATEQSPPPPAPAQPLQQSQVYYPNCSAARAAGAAPIYAGQPGYSTKLDRDGDGVACEK
ncbi:DUF1524 domain-containing protein [Skermania sp. ID1734]|uniref:GmrSD restriction endonuclease domain-containing protein n=1 Tax=Skermania sp. ID1734 TaxID=2597516 RepID=UPI00117E092C|nr:DUF1524 domain-containing protein [Skermania sp. ID1734]TSD98085.1 DUF1524 domain-containing protein [Skermania sp. ID1734]